MKQHNRASAIAAKVTLREHVLAQVTPARVLDCYCGPVGEMHRAVWHRAHSYAGIDLEWRLNDQRRRFVGDVLRILRAIDLAPFNVFDLDAFGSPWETALVIAARRKWVAGESGAFVFTDGSGAQTRLGAAIPRAVALLTGFSNLPAGSTDGSFDLGRLAVDGLLKRAGVTQKRRWEATSRGGGVGSFPMLYTAVTFTA